MPQAQTQDPVDRFVALPVDKQKEMFEKLSPGARKNLIDKVKAKKTATPAAKPESGWSGAWKAVKEDVSGLLKPSGFNPYPGMGQEEKAQAAGQAYLADQERKKAGYSTAYRMTVPFAQSVGVNVGGMEEAARKGDVGGVLGHAASVPLVMAAAEGAVRGGGAAMKGLERIQEKGIPPSLTKAATKPVVQKLLYDRSMKVKEHLQAAADSAQAEVSQKWQHLEKTIDGAKPEGSIDISGIRAEAAQAVKERIHIPQKLPETVKTIQAGAEPPKVFGERLDLSNAAHKALYDKLKEQGAIPESSDVITFAKARQMRSKLGSEIWGRSGTLSGEARSVGIKVYNDLTDAMSKVSSENGMPGAFADANKLHSEYMDTFVDKRAPLAKALRGKNPHEIMGPLSDPKFAEQARRIMAKYQKHGIDVGQITKDGVIFQKLQSGLPSQMRTSRWELIADTATLGGASIPRQAYNFAQRYGAIRSLEKPQEFSTRPPQPTGEGSVGPESNVEMERRGQMSPDTNPQAMNQRIANYISDTDKARAEVKQTSGGNPARDTNVLRQVQQEHPNWTLSQQLMEAARRVQ